MANKCVHIFLQLEEDPSVDETGADKAQRRRISDEHDRQTGIYVVSTATVISNIFTIHLI